MKIVKKKLSKIFGRTLPVSCGLALLFLAFSAVKSAAQPAGTAVSTFTVTAEIPSLITYFVEARDIDTLLPAEGVSWGSQIVGTGWRLPRQYIHVDIYSNHIWKLHIYTNNENADTGPQKAGLISQDNSQRLPMGWLVSDTPDVTLVPGVPGELIKSDITHSGGQAGQASWTWLKDFFDENDPHTSPDWDESFQSAFNEGYTTVLYGSHHGCSLAYEDMDAETPVAIFLQADFRHSDGNKTYSTTICLDFITE